MKWTIALACLIVCAGLAALSRTRDTTPAAPPTPAPSHIDAEFDPEFNVMAISWDQRVPSGERLIGDRYRRQSASREPRSQWGE